VLPHFEQEPSMSIKKAGAAYPKARGGGSSTYTREVLLRAILLVPDSRKRDALS